MSTYLALTFGTLLSSQGTDTSFKPLSQALRAFVSVLLRSYFVKLIRSESVLFPDFAFVFRDLTARPTC